MAEVLGTFEPQALMVLIVASVGLVPVLLYYERTPQWFVYPYGFLLVGAIATNLENVVLPDLLNLVEHFVGNMGAGAAFAAAAYVYRKQTIEDDGTEPPVDTEG